MKPTSAWTCADCDTVNTEGLTWPEHVAKHHNMASCYRCGQLFYAVKDSIDNECPVCGSNSYTYAPCCASGKCELCRPDLHPEFRGVDP